MSGVSKANIPEGWVIREGSLYRRFVWKNFNEAFGFITQVALLAEQMDHHPWWSNSYNKVEISLITHDAGNAITEKDYELAQRINHLLKVKES